MKLAINLVLSFGMLALCMWLVWPDHETRQQVRVAFERLDWGTFAPYLLGYIGLLVVTHLTRSLRWNHLLAPRGVKIGAGPLLAISSVGFMAILALPARLGEFVRPGLLRKHGVTASAALGMVAVERIVDGLLVSLFVFGAFFALRGPGAPGWMMPTAYAALGVFAGALVFLVFAMRKPKATVRFCLAVSLLPRFAPRFASAIEHKLLDMISGFDMLKDRRNLSGFMLWSLVYWTANGLGIYVLARGFFTIEPRFDLALVGGFAVTGLVAVGITLPNSPGLVGQFQWFTLLGLSLYLGPAAVNKKDTVLYPVAFAFANTHYLLQVIWYVGMGALSLATPWVSFHDLRIARKTGPEPAT
ncbi:MAG TPA: lysylphosphatidylglycerol synthase transmembrane domain-containing protein [Kofleriaceae bacterium]|nr:lysylphosphatidylglycerol synthase transmembrane domain-containing protein [Kofleriaceae bacterium]